jgi:hypothetical protein
MPAGRQGAARREEPYALGRDRLGLPRTSHLSRAGTEARMQEGEEARYGEVSWIGEGGTSSPFINIPT